VPTGRISRPAAERLQRALRRSGRGLLYRIVSSAIFAVISTDDRTLGRARAAASLAGITAAIFFAFCIPFWIASNRAYPASFDILLLLATTDLFIGFVMSKLQWLKLDEEASPAPAPGTPMSRGVVQLLLFAFLYGLGIAEFTTFVVLAPVFGLFLLLVLWRSESLRSKLIIPVVLCGLADFSSTRSARGVSCPPRRTSCARSTVFFTCCGSHGAISSS